MLANGTRLYYSETPISSGTSGWTEIPDLKEVPDMGVDPERVDNTGLNDTNRQYEQGIGDTGETMYLFKYPANKEAYATSAWKLGREWQQSGKTIYFREVMKDGFESKFSGTCSAKRTGGALNGIVDVQLNIAINSNITYTEPTT